MKKIAKKTIFVLFVLFAVGMTFTGCSKEAADTVKIGGIFPLSGNVAVFGTECRNGVEMAISEINAAGGVNGKMLELIAEDDEQNYHLYHSILHNDYNLLHAWNGAEAVELFITQNPHLILMDINMPVMNA